jgi:hypothetical protein
MFGVVKDLEVSETGFVSVMVLEHLEFEGKTH